MVKSDYSALGIGMDLDKNMMEGLTRESRSLQVPNHIQSDVD